MKRIIFIILFTSSQIFAFDREQLQKMSQEELNKNLATEICSQNKNKIKRMSQLLKAGANPNTMMEAEGITNEKAILFCCRQRLWKELAELVKHTDINSSLNDNGDNIPMYLNDFLINDYSDAEYERNEPYAYLIKLGLNINYQNAAGNTLLHIILANRGNHSDRALHITEFLIDRGLNISRKNKQGLSIIDVAKASGCRKIINFLIEYEDFIDWQQYELIRQGYRPSQYAEIDLYKYYAREFKNSRSNCCPIM